MGNKDRDKNKSDSENRLKKIHIKEEIMRRAIELAIKNVDLGYGPFAAIITDFDGQVISSQSNSVIRDDCPTKHAEINTIEKACKKIGKDGLRKCVIYSTTEPCPMCFGAIHWAKIPIIVYGSRISDAKILGMNELKISNQRLKTLSDSQILLIKDYMRDEALEIFDRFKKKKGKLY
jgi:guanine deaminase